MLFPVVIKMNHFLASGEFIKTEATAVRVVTGAYNVAAKSHLGNLLPPRTHPSNLPNNIFHEIPIFILKKKLVFST